MGMLCVKCEAFVLRSPYGVSAVDQPAPRHPRRSALDQLLCVGRVPDLVRNRAPDSILERFNQSVRVTTRIGGIGTVRRLLLVFGPAISSRYEFQRSPATPDQARVTRIDPQPSDGRRRSSTSRTTASPGRSPANPQTAESVR